MSTHAQARLFFFLLCLGVAAPAAAVEVFVNGVKVSGALVDATLEVTQVRFDAKGDVHIQAPGYKIEVAGSAPASAPPSAPPSAAPSAAPAAQIGMPTVWLVVNVPSPGHYKLHLTVNGQPLVDIAPDQPQYVAELSSRLQMGENRIEVQVLPAPGAPALAAEQEAINVMVGEGAKAADGTLTLSRLLGSFKHPTGRLSAEAKTLAFTLSP